MRQRSPRMSTRPRTSVLAAGGLAAVLTVALAVSPAPAAAAAPPAAWDFNGDGYADLAVGVPGESIGRVGGAGLVEVIYGSSSGPTARRSQAWTRGSSGVKGLVERDDHFGSSTASADFDGDGYADLAIGALGGSRGSVTVLYGSRSGLTARDQLLTSGDAGLTDFWGPTMVAGDFDGDGQGDLALGADYASGSRHEQIGALNVLYGGRDGLRSSRVSRITKDTAGIVGDSQVGDAFGSHLASGDVNGDGRDDLALSSRVESGSGAAAYLLFGSSRGITATASQFFDADTPGITPDDTAFSGLATNVAIGDFNADGYAELVLADYDGGPPGSTTCADRAACPGAVLVLPGSARGARIAGKSLWYQDKPGVPGASEGADAFGWSLATGDLNHDGRADLAVGVFAEDLGSVGDAGAVSVFYGSASGLTSSGSQLWTQNSRGIKGGGEISDYWGAHVQIADFGHGPSADLVVSGDSEDAGTLADAGKVSVLYGSAAGVTEADQQWSQDSAGISGRAEAGDHFGVLD